MKVTETKDYISVSEIECINIPVSLDCGQSFRWKEKDGFWEGIAFSKKISVRQFENEIRFYGTNADDFNNIWCDYFDLNRDYKSITEKISSDEYMKKAVESYYGIRVLNQEPWETLCSFIISQNNNIPRIKGIIDRLCENFGEHISDGEYSFPTAEKIASLSVEDLSVLRAGFRNKYILDAAKKVASGEVDFEKIKNSPIETGREELQKITGVGPKVAECVLLYGFNKSEAFPVDVWVKRIMAEMYPDGLPECSKGVEGIAQQYLFHWRRNL